MQMTPERDFVAKLRLAELSIALRGVAGPARVLEVGAGAGWQAREFDRLGFDVDAVDVPGGNYSSARIWSVSDYDGKNLPFAEGSFDIVFTSNVLEHVEDLSGLLDEMWRVLKLDGQMIHVVPSASWRFWTSMSYYPHLLRRAWHRSRINVLGKGRNAETGEVLPETSRPYSRLRLFVAPAHGTAANPLSELFEFRQTAWRRQLQGRGVQIVYRPTRLLYSGYLLFGRALPIKVRRCLAVLLGSSCHIFFLRRNVRGS